MKIINNGTEYRVFGDGLVVLDKLPVGTYTVNFEPLGGGYSLDRKGNLESNEEKVYGSHDESLNKVFNAYDKMNRNIGVLLSGDKGIGKSLFTRLLSEKAILRGMPVIIITNETPSLADFLLSIEQEALIIFDEFEKVFSTPESQNKLLSLFDGLNSSRHIYALTINDITKLSEFLLNRTGRIHYHFRFKYPTSNEIREYLTDKLEEQYYSRIDDVVRLSLRMKLNYDLLRSIAFELNTGVDLNDALKDLNIEYSMDEKYNMQLRFKNGSPFADVKLFDKIQLSDGGRTSFDIYPRTALPGCNNIEFTILNEFIEVDSESEVLYIPGDIMSQLYRREKAYEKVRTGVEFYYTDSTIDALSSYFDNIYVPQNSNKEVDFKSDDIRSINSALTTKGLNDKILNALIEKIETVGYNYDDLTNSLLAELLRDLAFDNLERIELLPVKERQMTYNSF